MDLLAWSLRLKGMLGEETPCCITQHHQKRKNKGLQTMYCNFTHCFTTHFWRHFCHLSQLFPKSPSLTKSSDVYFPSHCTGTPWPLCRPWPWMTCYCLLAECGNQDQQTVHIRKQHLWLAVRAGLSESLHIPAGCTKIWFPKSKPKLAYYTL